MRTECSVEIDRPLGEVFEFTTDHVAEWSIIVVEEEVLEETPDGVGTTFRVLTEDRGRQVELHGVVTRHEPPTAHAVHMVGNQFEIVAEYTFEELDGRTRVTQDSTVRGKGLFGVILVLFGWLMRSSSCKAQERELANLKRILEERETV